jgi:hypothetical protein
VNAIHQHEVFLFDVDGTLAHEGAAPGQDVLCALSGLLQRGKWVGIVTSRGIDEVRGILPGLAKLAGMESTSLRLRFFTSSASSVYAPCPGRSEHLELVECLASEEQQEAVQTIATTIAKLDKLTVIDRGAQQTIVTEHTNTMTRVRQIAASQARLVRWLLVAPNQAHVLPRNGGKHAALAYYRREIGPRASIAFGDGFYQAPELDICGNDMDWAGAATTCVQVGRIEPRDPRVHYLPLGADGPDSTLRVLELMDALSMQDIAARPPPKSLHRGAFETELRNTGCSQAVTSFFSKLVDYCVKTLDPEDVDRRLSAAGDSLRGRRDLLAAARCLGSEGPLDRSFGRWAGFEGSWDWVLRWLWDEHLARPGVALASHFAERARAPLLPEELALSLVRVLPNVCHGDRVVFIGKDAECALPIFVALLERFRAHGIIAGTSLDPIGVRICARKAPAGTMEDSAEHLELGSLGRQLWTLLDDSERQSPVSREPREAALGAVGELAAEERLALESAFGGRFHEALDRTSLGQLAMRIAGLGASPALDRYVTLCKDVIYRLHPRLVELSEQPAAVPIESLIVSHLSNAGAHAASIIEQYTSTVGRSLLETAQERQALHDILSRMLGGEYATLRSFRFPFTPVLAALMQGTQMRRLLTPSTLFVDASFNTGTTVLFLRALRHIVAPDARFEFAALGGVSLHQQLSADVAWHGHAYLPVFLEEGAPHTFDFFYDARDERVTYASLVAELDRRQMPHIGDAHIEALCERFATHFEPYRDLAHAGVDFRDLVRWWLRRDPVWELRVLCDRLRFRWPYARTVWNQQRAITLLHELDAVVDADTRKHIVDQDRALSCHETRCVLEEWDARRRGWLARARGFIDEITRDPELIRQYLAEPTSLAWRRLQRSLIRRIRPPAPWE